jgi:hypothetical protein
VLLCRCDLAAALGAPPSSDAIQISGTEQTYCFDSGASLGRSGDDLEAAIASLSRVEHQRSDVLIDEAANSSSSGSDDDESTGPRNSLPRNGVRHNPSPVQRRVAASGSVAHSASSALEFFGLRSGSSSNSSSGAPRRNALQPLRSPVSFANATADPVALSPQSSPLLPGSNPVPPAAPRRLAQLDARATPVEDLDANENLCAVTPPAHAARDSTSAASVGLPAIVGIEGIPALALALDAALSSGFVRKQAALAFLTSSEAKSQWLPSLLSLLGADDARDPEETVMAAFGVIIRLLLDQDDLLDVLCEDNLFVSFIATVGRVIRGPRDVADRFRRVQFRQALPLESPELLSSVHRCFRLSFLRGKWLADPYLCVSRSISYSSSNRLTAL